ncbi:MAG: histidine phosphatase family protein [Alphaproteobacteria bacterium]|nr:histidine phosphatase family protein [Alphaproteobacteria bacterium]
MKTLYLLRHAKSAWDDPTLNDFDRPLAPRGRKAAPRMGKFMRSQGLLPDLVLCSSAERARQTWSAVAAELDDKIPVEHAKELYMADASGLIDQLRSVEDQVDRVLMVGHNPGMERCARALVGTGDKDTADKMAAKFPTAALAVIEFDVKRWRDVRGGSGRLTRFVLPRELS